MSTERASILERMTSAMAGSGDIEVMGALGAAQVASGRLNAGDARQLAGVFGNGIGGMALVATVGRSLTALQARTVQGTYDTAKEAMTALVQRLNVKRRWRLNERNEERVAESALLMHLHPSCPHCHGRRYELLPGTSTVGNRICRPCGGTGQRPYPKRFQEEVAATMNVLGLVQGLAERAVAKELNR